MIAATFASVMQTIGFVCVALLALMFMIVVHEFGHYLAGRLLGFKINEFAIGFGPPIFKKKSKKTGTVFAIRPIPLGGFCLFEDEESDSESPTAFNNQAPWKRLIVLVSGALFNFISGLIIITIFFTFYGQVLPKIKYVNPTSVNYESGSIEPGDIILSVDGKQVNILEVSDIDRFFSKTGDTAELLVLRDGKRTSVTMTKCDYTQGEYDEQGNFTPDEDAQTVRGFGIIWTTAVQKIDFFSAIGRAFSFMFFVVMKIFIMLGSLFTGTGLSNVGGSITTIKVMSEAAQAGFAVLAYAVCLISANLAVMNLLPIPALDGSKIVFTLIEWIFKKPINRKVEGVINAVGFALILCFAIVADVFQFIR